MREHVGADQDAALHSSPPKPCARDFWYMSVKSPYSGRGSRSGRRRSVTGFELASAGAIIIGRDAMLHVGQRDLDRFRA